MKESKRKHAKQDIVVEVDVRKLVRFLLLLLMVVLCILSIAFFVRRFLTVQHFSVSGISEYEVEEIVAASGVRRGERLYLLDRKAIAERVLEKCPYLSSVEVKTAFPDRLVFEVEGRTGSWYIELMGARYALDGDLMVLEEIEEVGGMTKLVLPNLKSALAGELPSFGNSEVEMKKTLELISALRESSLKARLTAADLSDRTRITIEVDGRYTVLLGDDSDFQAKLTELEVILERDSVKNSEGGEINATVPGAMTFRAKKNTVASKDASD